MTSFPIGQFLQNVSGDVVRRAPKIPQSSGVEAGVTSEVERRIADAHALGVLEGRAEAQVEFAAQSAAERREFERKFAAEMEALVSEQAGKLAARFVDVMSDIETRIADQVGRVLQDFVVATVRERAVAELMVLLRDLLERGQFARVTITAPAHLLDALKERFEASVQTATFVEGPGADVTVAADDTVIETRIRAWVAAIDGDGP